MLLLFVMVHYFMLADDNLPCLLDIGSPKLTYMPAKMCGGLVKLNDACAILRPSGLDVLGCYSPRPHIGRGKPRRGYAQRRAG